MRDPNCEQAIVQAIVDTLDQPMFVLDEDFRVVAANRSSRRTFNVSHADLTGANFFDLGYGELDLPEVRKLINRPLQAHVSRSIELECEIAGRDRRLRLSARDIATPHRPMTLVEISDVTDEHAEVDRPSAVSGGSVLVEEMSHRLINNLMMIGSILMVRAQSATHLETRDALSEAHQRVMAIAGVQKHLVDAGESDVVDISIYLARLCDGLIASVVEDRGQIHLELRTESHDVSARHAAKIGLIATELVMNALKHAFPCRSRGGHVIVGYEADALGWCLTVLDDGVGDSDRSRSEPGIGSRIVNALTAELGAEASVHIDPGYGRVVRIAYRKSRDPSAMLE